MQQGLKTPFVLIGNQREDDTPLHKLLREALTNAVVHADFYGRQGLVVQKSEEGYKLSNPGSLRISIKEAIDGGISDPRNGVMLKMFSLVDFGERAGSGLNEVCTVWEKVFHTPAILEEIHKNGVDRTILTLSNNGNKQDVGAMLKLYGAECIEDINDTDANRNKTIRKSEETDINPIQNNLKPIQTDTIPIQNQTKDAEKKNIINALRNTPTLSMDSLSRMLGITKSSVQRRLDALVKEGKLQHIGPSNGGSWKVTE